MFRASAASERHVDVPKARPRRRSRAQGGRRKRARDPRGVSWLNANERAEVARVSRSRRRGRIGPDWSKIAAGSPFRLIGWFGGHAKHPDVHSESRRRAGTLSRSTMPPLFESSSEVLVTNASDGRRHA